MADGHEIATHAYSHNSLAKMSQQEVSNELDKAEKAITAVAPKPVLFRPPGSIVLLHDGQYPLPTPQAIGIIIDQLQYYEESQ